MSTTIDQKAYLQKYLGGPSGDKKKKKKKVAKGQGFKIIDDDLDFSKLRALDGDELDILDEGEDGPQIAGIIDERPDEIKKLEQFKTTSKWRVISQDDGFNSKLQIEEIKKDVKEVEKENELIFGKMYSDSEDEKKQNDSDISPPRKNSKNDENKTNTKKHKTDSDSDFSPPRKRHTDSPPKNSKSKNDVNSDSDLSPLRKKEIKVRKPSRWEQIDDDDKKYRNRSPSADKSPKEKKHKQTKNKTRNRSNSSDLSPPRRSNRSERGKEDFNTSPPRRSRKDSSNKRNRNRSNSSDLSPPRRSQKNEREKNDSDASPPRKSRKESNKRNKTPDSDFSPPRRQKQSPKRHHNQSDSYKNSMDRFNSDRNYPDKKRKRSPERGNKEKGYKRSHRSAEDRSKKHSSDSDASPPRKGQSSRKDDRRNYRRSSDSPPPSNVKMAKTLEGKKAGLQDANQLRKENDAFRKREEEAFSKMTDEVSGRNAKAVSRKGKRETSEERQKLKEKAERQKELDEKYKKWSRGLKQIEAQEARVQEYMHEASKPLARHKDDRDLEQNLRQVERAGDPMLQYIRERKAERGELPPEKPKYKGNFPPNRFNIRPGYRWDGVDRSNGYEKKYFEQQSKKRAQEEEAYKWSTEDL